ncbi:MAG: ABC transporter ATP-binding protein [Xanthobacteraceae bacterium]|nr:ABC transporter ATP-binding protein [Xanthobacteraceae bacterium]QYK45129.1 MAG: ABC transporter ATP-binding protein [Xanthobacteraceae bacterium]
MLNVRSVDKIYPNGVRALDRISLDVKQGEIVAVVGGSGCGKSTLLRLIAGLDPATKGRVELDGETILAPHECVGLIFQEPRLLPWLTVAQNVGFGLSHLPRGKREAIVGEVLLRVGLSDYADRWPRELSGGQAQRVAIARALAPRVKVLLLDEPFSALDAFTRASLHQHVLDLWRAYKPTLILVTHDVEEAAVLADRVVVMQPKPGRISAQFDLNLPHPRDRYGADVEAAKRKILHALDQSLRIRAPGEELAPAAAI